MAPDGVWQGLTLGDGGMQTTSVRRKTEEDWVYAGEDRVLHV